MTTIVQAHAAEDLLALVPHLLGFAPESSLVVILFAGKRSRGALRVRLPAEAALSKRAAKTVAERALAFASRAPGVDGVVPVLFVDRPFGRRTRADGRAAPPGAAIVDAFVALARERGLIVKDALCSARDGWGSYLDPQVPIGGRSLALVEASPVARVAPVPDELVTAQIPPADPTSIAAVEQAVRGFEEQLASIVGVGVGVDDDADLEALSVEVMDTMERLAALPVLFEHALDEGVAGLSSEDVALLLVALERAWASDVALMQWAFGVELGEELFFAEHEHRDTTAAELDDIEVFRRVALLLTGDGPQPDVPRVHDAIALLFGIAALAPVRYRPSPLCMLAWFSWALGQSTRAAAFLDQLAEIAPGHSLAPTIQAMVVQGHLPAWAFASAASAEASSADTAADVTTASDQPAA
ncbi:MAG TPA: DUF4192 family protein [Plantibacter sp.]|uniref:DUF4192 family protein n=1 Tax=Plantibacter sp. TaxID=1871045 RepID=UPI002C1B0E2F|nr:DUF4192 family protein [Plantibacter sp.]